MKIKLLEFSAFLLLILTLSTYTVAQDRVDEPGYYYEGDSSKISEGTYILLPPMDTLIDMAIRNSPRVKFMGKDIDISEWEIKKVQKEWLNNVYLEGGINYGLYDQASISGPVNSQMGYLVTNESLRYYFGASIKMPLDMVLNHRAKVNQAKLVMERDFFIQQHAAQEIAEQVIIYYNRVKFYNAALNIKVRDLETTRLNLEKATKDFEEGILTLPQYTMIRSQHGQTQEFYEKAKNDLKTSYNLLENAVGQPLK